MNSTNPLPWDLSVIKVEALWASGLTGSGVRAGHLDGGVDAAHPVLRGRLASVQVFDRDGFPCDGAPAGAPSEHGTRTASLICGGSLIGTAVGAAPGAFLYSGTVLEGGSTLVRILMGMNWLIDCGVQVACLPLGVAGCSPIFESMIAAMRQKGILPVAPVGNTGAGRALAPGCYAQVLSVGAVDQAGQVPAFSGSLSPPGTLLCLKPDLVAPGEGVAAASLDGGLASCSGTSYAAALVAGTACLLFQSRPDASPEEVEEALIASCAPLSPGQSHLWGRGLLDAPAALAYLHEHLGRPRNKSQDHARRAQPASIPFIDRRLVQQLKYADADSMAEAILIAPEGSRDDDLDERGPAGSLIDQVTGRSGVQPVAVRYLPCGRIAIVKALARFMRAVLEMGSFSVASAVSGAAYEG